MPVIFVIMPIAFLTLMVILCAIDRFWKWCASLCWIGFSLIAWLMVSAWAPEQRVDCGEHEVFTRLVDGNRSQYVIVGDQLVNINREMGCVVEAAKVRQFTKKSSYGLSWDAKSYYEVQP